MSGAPDRAPILEVRDAELRFGERVVWHHLSLDVQPGEFVAVLGPNGTGKTSLLRTLLGQHRLRSGTIRVNGHAPRSGDRDLGYIPQQRGMDRDTPMRGRDLVRLGLDGHHWGWRPLRRTDRARIDELIDAVGAREYADSPVGLLSGGEQQRLRVAQALVGQPRILLCDEPLLSLDLHHQRRVAELIDQMRRSRDTAVVFVTHEINPILPYVDRVLYLAGGHHLIGPPREVMTTQSLSRLFGAHIEVVEVGGRLVIVGGDDHPHHHPHVDDADEEHLDAYLPDGRNA
ncbi:metal ABC transporter ATP-binding protein [Brevibacterium senegalense]|uniref:metal ABC transporter ATP-binding protein n=1 Tax=Brevibacterium senegalense TaxID=1033736 RepID=UPI000318C99C|nr:ABC transporter ATP-binding protein [Brevibacterium senegalense]